MSGEGLREAVEALADEWEACDEHGNPLREGSLGEAANELRALLVVRDLRRIADETFDPVVLGAKRALHEAADAVGKRYTTAAWLRQRADALHADHTLAASEAAPTASEREAGLEARYRVEKINDPTGKHAECRYFVLDPVHDLIARQALAFYRNHARRFGYEALADDLTAWLDSLDPATTPFPATPPADDASEPNGYRVLLDLTTGDITEADTMTLRSALSGERMSRYPGEADEIIRALASSPTFARWLAARESAAATRARAEGAAEALRDYATLAASRERNMKQSRYKATADARERNVWNLVAQECGQLAELARSDAAPDAGGGADG